MNKLPKEQKQGYYDSLRPLQKTILNKYKFLHKAYLRATNEVEARASGDKAIEKVKSYEREIHSAGLGRFEFDSMGAENKSASIIKPFIDKVSKINKMDWAKYDLALKNGYKDVVDTIADKKLTKCQVFLRGKNPARVRMSIFILGFIF